MLVLCLTIFATVESGQDSADTGQAATKRAQAAGLLKPAALQIPKGEGAWTVRVIQGGGLTGQSLDIAITSVGELKCLPEAEASCSKVASGDALQAVAVLVDPKLLRNSKSSLSDSCRDCSVTSITIGYRDEKAKVDTYFAYWDDVTAAKAPFQLVRIATTLINAVKNR